MNHPTRLATLTAALAALFVVPAGIHAQVADANVRVHATVAEIDHDNRLLMLSGYDGLNTEFMVPDDLTGFDRIEVGDTLTVTFRLPLALHLRRPDAPSPDLTELSAPGGRTAPIRTQTATVIQVDPSVPSVSLRGEAGGEATFRVTEGFSLDDFAVGDLVDVIYSIPEVVSLGNR